MKEKQTEYDFYEKIANWSFDDINCKIVNYTNWIYEEQIRKYVNKNSRILDIGTAAGEKVINCFPDCREIVGTDFSSEMIKSANKNLKKSRRHNIKFRIMDSRNMDTPNDYFDLVTARHTVTEPNQIYKTLKKGGYLIIRGVDKMDCWQLKKLFGRGQAYKDKLPISQRDYERVIDAGFKDVELIPIHAVEYFKKKEDLYALLLKTPILCDKSEENNNLYEVKDINKNLLNKYINENTTDKGIKLIRRYYGIVARK